VCAEIPDPNENPRLWKVVTETMLHGQCGPANPSAPCMRRGRCCFGYPKSFVEQTQESDEYSYLIYRRRNNGRTFSRTEGGFVYDNRWVAPFNAWLSLTFDCHINLEICSNITAVQYIYKYVYKGPDRAEIVIVPAEQEPPNPNEVQEYQRGASEASWRILQFPMHKEFPSVQHLPVHLPNQQQVTFDETGNIMQVLATAMHT